MINIKIFSLISLVTLFSWGKISNIAFFSEHNVDLNKFIPKVHSRQIYNKGQEIFYYIYSEHNFDTDYLQFMFVHVDNKGVITPTTNYARSMNIDVDPNKNAAKGSITLYKGGQLVLWIFNPRKPKKPIIKAHLLIR